MFLLYCVFVFFFFKQKTAYEMRISDWSSDVCSSDLLPDEVRARYDWGSPGRRAFSVSLHNTPHRLRTRGAFFVGSISVIRLSDKTQDISDSRSRSEEHTSEFQPLMRISYAVLCLKKKITIRLRQHY